MQIVRRNLIEVILLEILKELKEAYKDLHFVDNEIQSDKEFMILVSGFRGNGESELLLSNNEEVQKFRSLPISELVLLKDFIGIYHDSKVYILLRNSRSNGAPVRFLFEEPVHLMMSYNGMELSAIIGQQNTLLEEFFSLSKILGYRRNLNSVITIENYNYRTEESFHEDIRKILNSLLFDLYYISNIMLEPYGDSKKTDCFTWTP